MPVPTFSSNLLINASPSTQVGGYTVILVGSGQGGVNHETSFILTVVGGGETTGGFVVPIDKLSLLAPYIGMAFLIVAVAFGAILRAKRRRRNTDSVSSV